MTLSGVQQYLPLGQTSAREGCATVYVCMGMQDLGKSPMDNMKLLKWPSKTKKSI